MQFIFEQLRCGGDRNFGYLLADRKARTGVLIDPSYAPDMFVQRAREQHLTITHVINTHGHPDHVNGNAGAVEATGAKVAAHPESPAQPDVPLADGQELGVGSLTLRVLHVPGHAADHLVLYEPTYQILVTGDLLFVGKVGGTGNETDARAEWHSLQRVLATFPDTATVWPGHDYGARPCSTLAIEKQTNPFLLCADIEAFLNMKRTWADVKQRFGLK